MRRRSPGTRRSRDDQPWRQDGHWVRDAAPYDRRGRGRLGLRRWGHCARAGTPRPPGRGPVTSVARAPRRGALQGVRPVRVPPGGHHAARRTRGGVAGDRRPGDQPRLPQLAHRGAPARPDLRARRRRRHRGARQRRQVGRRHASRLHVRSRRRAGRAPPLVPGQMAGRGGGPGQRNPVHDLPAELDLRPRRPVAQPIPRLRPLAAVRAPDRQRPPARRPGLRRRHGPPGRRRARDRRPRPAPRWRSAARRR